MGKKKKTEQQNDQNKPFDLDPYEINFLPQFKKGRGPKEAFVNEHGVTIGDHEYESPNSPLTKWTDETDPAIMAGDEWVHPYKDIGFQTEENKDYFERGIEPERGKFTHPDKDVSFQAPIRKKENKDLSGRE
ncbi:DUF3905 domain-containing protein [Chengkuizengella axinellae]|uniref:DUF3905 domain-containing protein n=1 Tax=Chengkuizengella axinellae TaxID=3064388 RepID=A0ABT9J0A2_9BACL|nr:DUF3905 domain-containing protein [Chengkuizengella sp. 2205SS18-9]MDP5275051.1 DUF3905 domain-containing protein [Chengkuizengella sp. 2205SS18-9]